MAPFIFHRKDLAKRTLDRVLGLPNRALAIFGPRQTGKTTFLNYDLAVLARQRGIETLYVDFMTSPEPLETLVGRMTELVHTEASKPGRAKVRGLKALGVGVDFEVSHAQPRSKESGVLFLVFARADSARIEGIAAGAGADAALTIWHGGARLASQNG